MNLSKRPLDLAAVLRSITRHVLREMRNSGWHQKNHKYMKKGGRPTAYDVNNGWCEEWAGLAEVATGGESVWLEDVLNNESLAHCVLEFEGRYFDSQCMMGTSYPISLVR